MTVTLSDVVSWRLTPDILDLPPSQQFLRRAIARLNELGGEDNWRASRVLWPLVTPVPIVTTVLGDSRAATDFAADGDFMCPYCTSPIFRSRGQKACENPACDANPGYTPETLTRVRAKREAEEKERAEWRRNHTLAMERIQRENDARRAWEQEQVAEARKRGACLRCLFQPGYQCVKFIKHRGLCPKER